MTSPYAKTARAMTDDALRLVGDFHGSGADGKWWLYTEAVAALKWAVLELVRKTGILKSIQVIPLKEGYYIYDLPWDCLRPLRFDTDGRSGTVISPVPISEMDYAGEDHDTDGTPTQFFKDILNHNQVGFVPNPDEAGSSYSADSDYLLLRRLTDSDGGELSYDDELALRRISGAPFVRVGDGSIIRWVISPEGNITVTYVRAPSFPDDLGDYIDGEIPVWCHKDLKYGAALWLMTGYDSAIWRAKKQVFTRKWRAMLGQVQRLCEHKGPLDAAEPM
jgi:hypothetical protein